MEEILASIRRIIEPEGTASAPVFTSLAGEDTSAPMRATVAEAPKAAAIESLTMLAVEPVAPAAVEAASASDDLTATRPWGVEANDARPSPAARDLRSPITAGFDRFASALQRLNRRPEKLSVASTTAVTAVASVPATARSADQALLRQETSMAVAKLRAVADSMGGRARATAAPAAVATLAEVAPDTTTAVVELAENVVVEAAPAVTPILLAPEPMPVPAEPEAVCEPEVVAEFITVVPPAAANDAGDRRAEAEGFDEAALMMALHEEMERAPAAATGTTALAMLPVAREVVAVEPRIAEIGALIAEEAGGRTAEAFADLASAVRAGTMGSMEEIVRGLLQPMLREWMDDNLPHLVERMVQDEIHRAARGSAAA
ncbi:PopZ family protein [Antarcticirhabdus aurantiaca]|uniref:DUF2497 domain-containing protein n=1 Tax=Antarcticirhabdus aurantiaca TaxID=2606717 RepID=A0ACD4NW97_9HYPH|nr:DUF2497 domain-containing protein [Antarcticirhabdus aurantiaca]WAJ31139.1 DUF2497 domain-containing protein [Jeongeuplla avenae]